MLTHLMFWVLVGHFVGDYLFQSKHMALSKGNKGWSGITTCVTHCTLYALAVTTAAGAYLWGWTGPWGTKAWLVWCVVFLTHFPIDRWSLADKWLKVIGGRQLDEIFKEAVAAGNIHPDQSHAGYSLASHNHPSLADRQLVADFTTRQSFTALVYAVVDNTLHFLLMTAGFATLLYFGVIT